jgi:hypothetical protein
MSTFVSSTRASSFNRRAAAPTSFAPCLHVSVGMSTLTTARFAVRPTARANTIISSTV